MSSVINETLLLIKSAFEAGVNIFNGGTAVSSSNPLPVTTRPESKTSSGQATLEGLNVKCWINCPAVAAKFSSVQIWNPVGSGINLLIIGMNGMNSSGTTKWFQHLDATKLSTQGGFQQNLKAGGAALPIEMYFQALDAKTATNALGVIVSAVTAQGGGLQMSAEFVCIPEGYGLRYEAETANIGITMFATIIASSNA